MCGIVGVLASGGNSRVDEPLLRKMLGAVRHRGPDEFGVYLFGDNETRIGLGSARLSIIDLVGGQQPISNEDGTLWIVFNGEVFNYRELRSQLESFGHRFRTETDTEVLLHLFEQHGPDCIHRLNGQFAFAIWDARQRRLFLARDRCGVRPLFYAFRGGMLVFGSEIKAILCHPEIQAELDPVTLDQIFTFWSPLPPRTAFQGIHSLPPGCWMEVLAEGQMRVQRYWRFSFPEAGREPCRDQRAAAEQLSDLLRDAVRLRLRADVPVGAYLSGGLDSAVVAAMVRECGVSDLETFSIAFSDPAFDESDHQRRMAEFLGTRHHVINCSHEDVGRAMPSTIWHTEMPVLRTAPVPLYLLSELVRTAGFKVVLTGEGADELLAGYNIFKEAKIRRFWARQAHSAVRPLLLGRIYPYIQDLTQG